jgi:hypothetical protein
VSSIRSEISAKGSPAESYLWALALIKRTPDIARVVGDIFDIAIEKNVAVGFHIDD